MIKEYYPVCNTSQTPSCETYLKKAKTRKLSKLSKTEQNRLAKLNAMLDELRRAENVQNRRVATWLTEAKYESFESDWESQQQPSKPAANDLARTAIKPITPQKPLSNQLIS